MQLKHRSGRLVVIALVSAALSVLSAGFAATGAAAATDPSIGVTGSCGDVMTLEGGQLGAPINVTITIPDSNASDVWSFTATEQQYDAVTGAAFGDPFPLVPGELSRLSFDSTGSQFTSTGVISNSPGLTHGISYTATRTSPTPETCTSQAFWTNPGDNYGPTPENPTSFPGAP